MIGARANVDRVTQQIRQPLCDRKAETEPAAALARHIVELPELLEDRIQLSRGNADPGIPHLDAQRVAASPAAEQNLPLAGVLDRVREQVAQDLV